MNKYYYDLLPKKYSQKEEADFKNSPFFKVLDNALENGDILNIAITGTYGSGKTTHWQNYVNTKKISDNKILNISLADFDKGIEKRSINSEKNYNLDTKQINKIAFNIINQIVYQIPRTNIRNSKFQIKNNKSLFSKRSWKNSCWENIFRLIFFFLVLVSASFLILNTIRDTSLGFKNLLGTSYYFFLLLAVSTIIIFLINLVQAHRINISTSFNIVGGKFDINKSKEDEYTIFDYEKDEIVYLVSNSDAEYIVIEDIDRYDENNLFVYFRELSYLVNLKNDIKVRFIYLLRDDVFSSKDRTKFFDLVIPITPVVNGFNAKEKLLELFANLPPEVISPEYKTVLIVSDYLDDMRLIKNIYNEYIQFYINLDISNHRTLNKDQLFGLIILKNMFPKEYELMHIRRGYVDSVFKIFEEVKRDLLDDLHRDTVEKEREFINYNPEGVRIDVQEFINFIPKSISINTTLNQTKDSKLKELKAMFSDSDRKSRFYFRNENKILNYLQFQKEIVRIIPKFATYYNAEIRNRRDRLKRIFEDTLTKENMIRSYSLKKFSNSYPDEVEPIFNLTHSSYELIPTLREYLNELKSSHYFNLLIILLSEGLIGIDYSQYMTYMDNKFFSNNDREFLDIVSLSKSPIPDLRLDDIYSIKLEMLDTDYEKTSSFNYSLIEYLHRHDYEEELSILIKSVAINDNSLLLNYLERLDSNLELFSQLIEILFREQNDTLMNVLIYNTFSENLYTRVLFYTCMWDYIHQKDYIHEVYKYDLKNIINNNARVLELMVGEGNDLFYYLISKDIKFENLDVIYKKMDLESIEKLIEHRLYRLSYNNIIWLVSKLYYAKFEITPKLDEILHYILSESSFKNIKDYIEDNQEQSVLVHEYIDNTELIDLQQEELNDLLNDEEISKEMGEEVIKKLKHKILDLNSITNKGYWHLLVASEKIVINVENINTFFDYKEDPNFFEDLENLLTKLDKKAININEIDKNLYQALFENITNNKVIVEWAATQLQEEVTLSNNLLSDVQLNSLALNNKINFSTLTLNHLQTTVLESAQFREETKINILYSMIDKDVSKGSILPWFEINSKLRNIKAIFNGRKPKYIVKDTEINRIVMLLRRKGYISSTKGELEKIIYPTKKATL
ncbi:YobI family P-loop NTPase [Aerococcus viridans]